VGEAVLLCGQTTLELTMTWKKFKSIQLYGSSTSIDTHLVVDDPVLVLDWDVVCTYDLFEYIIESKLNKQN
jgi:hypothetical protein